ncbi:Heat shock 70 kDa protein 1-like [Hypsibius exemplaris]|uniref:Heat shock 70 kDa protein 1-like n=1 Tax=Hypsibius exemplaris TaxID=2072580 RepID=A0A1W0WZV9_HYPEX|nr:Heat shock 70 kDa protein 1-like [Hypsibius exemplaris]
MKNNDDIVLGIDLGTTNSCIAACYSDGQVVVIPSEDGVKTMSSCVFFDDGVQQVGVRASAKEHPENVIYEMKRLLGRDFEDAEVQVHCRRWPFKVINERDGMKVAVRQANVVGKFSPIEIGAIILTELHRRAVAFLKQPIKRTVICVPANFSVRQKNATKAAATLAGLEVLATVHEPTAAAVGYNAIDEAVPTGATFMAFDFGGGTLDVSVVERRADNVFKVLASAGDTSLGGADFDGRLMDHFIEVFRQKHQVDLREKDYSIGRAELLEACEKAKRLLSAEKLTQTKVVVPAIADDIALSEVLTRVNFNELCADLFERILKPVEKVLEYAGLSRNKMAFVMLIGSSSRMLKVQELLRTYFGPTVPVKMDHRPDETIAVGAAHYARNIVDGKEPIIDMTSATLGIRLKGGIMAPVIPRGTDVPVCRTKRYKTSFAGATAATISIYQGESEWVTENQFLADLKLDDISLTSESATEIEVVFAYDRFGMLKVTARDPQNNTQRELEVHM